MAAVVHRFANVMRTLFLAVAILAVNGVLPAMAIGSCETKACCARDAAATIGHPPCCNEMIGSTASATPVALTQRTTLRFPPIAATATTDLQIPDAVHDPSSRQTLSRAPARPPETFSILLI
jgi:hypothetical protein